MTSYEWGSQDSKVGTEGVWGPWAEVLQLQGPAAELLVSVCGGNAPRKFSAVY